MAPVPSPEIESVMRRLLNVWVSSELETIATLLSSDPSLRVLGFDADEWWEGPDEVLNARVVQSSELVGHHVVEIQSIEAFEDGSVGWVTCFFFLVTLEERIPIRMTAVVRLESGAWKVIQVHNSIPVSNEQVLGVDLTTTIQQLVTSVLEDSPQLEAVAGVEGTTTLVFTDIVDSTVFAETVGDRAWARTIGHHEGMIRNITARHGGSVVKFLGDGSMLSFESARAAVRAAVDIQQESTDGSFGVRIGIHTGEVIRTGDDLLGITVNKAARIASTADAGEIMVSSTTRDLVGSIDGIGSGRPRTVALKGLSDTHQIVPIEWS